MAAAAEVENLLEEKMEKVMNTAGKHKLHAGVFHDFADLLPVILGVAVRGTVFALGLGVAWAVGAFDEGVLEQFGAFWA